MSLKNWCGAFVILNGLQYYSSLLQSPYSQYLWFILFFKQFGYLFGNGIEFLPGYGLD